MRAILGTLRMVFGGILKDPIGSIFMILFSPLLLVLVSSSMSSLTVSPEVVNMNLSLFVEDLDETSESKSFKDILYSDAFQGLILKEEDREKAAYTLTLPKGFKEGIQGDKAYSLNLEYKGDKAGGSSYFLQDMIQRTLLNFKRELWKTQGQSQLIQSIYDQTPAPAIEVKHLEHDHILHSKGYFGLTGLQIVHVLFLVILAMGEKTMKKGTDLQARIHVSPQRKTALHFQNTLANYLYLGIVSTIFLLMMRFGLGSFSGNLLLHIAVNLLISIFVISIGSLLLAALPAGTAVYVTNALFLFHIVFGGVVGFDFGMGAIGGFLKRFNLFSLYIKPFVEISRGNTRDAFLGLLPFLFLAAGAYLMSLLIVSRKKVV